MGEKTISRSPGGHGKPGVVELRPPGERAGKLGSEEARKLGSECWSTGVMEYWVSRARSASPANTPNAPNPVSRSAAGSAEKSLGTRDHFRSC
jgi:hypothetical protein